MFRKFRMPKKEKKEIKNNPKLKSFVCDFCNSKYNRKFIYDFDGGFCCFYCLSTYTRKCMRCSQRKKKNQIKQFGYSVCYTKWFCVTCYITYYRANPTSDSIEKSDEK